MLWAGCGWNRPFLFMHRLTRSVVLAICVAGVAHHAFSTGDWMPRTVLDEGGKRVLETPEFFWELECRRIAQEFTPVEKRIAATVPEDPNAVDGGRGVQTEFTTRIDKEEFAAAIKAGEVKVADTDAALKQFADAREVINSADEQSTAPLPEEPASEFADYHRGALAFNKQQSKEAVDLWNALLARPATERKHRTLWATFMLGKRALRDSDFEGAKGFFQKTRQLAKEGFTDSLGLAAESYGWEAYCELELGHAKEAARLYLTQLASGDASAVPSLKFLVPDRMVAVFGDGGDTTEADVTIKKAYGVDSVEAALAMAAADPVLRRLVTAHILAVGVDMEYTDAGMKPRPVRQSVWLAAIEKAGVKTTPDAENLGWVAYSMGRYADAARWLKLSSGESSSALWLQAKLALRDGKVKESTGFFSQAIKALPKNEDLEASLLSGEELMPSTASRGDLGTVLLAGSEFVQALDAFIAADLWEDAAFVAERCLTTPELLDYAKLHFPNPSKELSDEESAKLSEQEFRARDHNDRFRGLVARRLVREDNYQLARTYFDAGNQKLLDEYTTTLAKAFDEKAGKPERARLLFRAAWMARHKGMELMGTEAGPDSASDRGSITTGDMAMVRLTGKTYAVEDMDDAEEEKPKPVAFVLPVSVEEKKRLTATKLNPERRFHYRHVAAGLAWKAAALMPDGTEETADVLNTAGNWLKDKSQKSADRFYQALERRCSKTKIGQEAVKKHWFTDSTGPWSTEESARDQAAEAASQN